MDSKRRLISNLIMGAIIVTMAVSMVFTVNAAKAPRMGQMPPGSQSMQNGDMPSQGGGDQQGGGMQAPPDKPDGSGQQSGDSNQQGGGMQAPPDKPDGSKDSQSGDSNQQSGGMQAPPDKPDGSDQQSGDSNQQGGMQAPPDKPDGSDQQSGDSNQQGGGMQAPPDMPDQSISGKYYALFGGEALIMALLIAYLICSAGNSRTFAETLRGSKRKAAFIVIAAVLAGGITLTDGLIASHSSASQMPTQMAQQDQNSSGSESAQGETTVDGEEQTLTDTYDATTEDTSAILVKNGGNMTLDGATVTKTGASTSTEASEFSGINAGILTTEGSTSTIKGSTITTDADGSNAVFSTGTDAKVYISDSTITTTGSRSARGLDATYGGYIEADNVKITTNGGSCATLATDRGEGTVKVTNSTLNTAGAGSPLIYSTGDISVTKTTGEATGAQITCIEGKNSATITDSALTASGTGNRGDVDQCGVFIYQSMSGDATEGTGTFTAKDSTLSISKDSDCYDSAPMFLVTNTDAVIDLTNTDLNFGSGTLLNVTATDEWGQSGSNGGDVEFTATNQVLEGDITIDDISTLALSLQDGSTFEGSINTENTGKEVTLTISKDASVKLTGDTYVTSLEDEDSSYGNIDFNGHKLYVNGKAIR